MQLLKKCISCHYVKFSVCCALSGVEGSGDEDTRELAESDPDTDDISIAGQIHLQYFPVNVMTVCLNCILRSSVVFFEVS